jgi:hypothetical protein
MTSIQPIDNQLISLIEKEKYREILNTINDQYENMETYISNLRNDISAIDVLINSLEDKKNKGYDIGTSLETLFFQRTTLEIDLNFYLHMKKNYINKLYQDLYNYTINIINSALDIENNKNETDLDTMISNKLGECKKYDKDMEYSMTDIYTLLSNTEKNLLELSTDIASFSELIVDAQNKEKRGFAVGNLVLNLEAQKDKLVLEFKSYCHRLENFLEQNKEFSIKCYNKIKLISNEVDTTEEEFDNEEANQIQ